MMRKEQGDIGSDLHNLHNPHYPTISHSVADQQKCIDRDRTNVIF